MLIVIKQLHQEAGLLGDLLVVVQLVEFIFQFLVFIWIFQIGLGQLIDLKLEDVLPLRQLLGILLQVRQAVGQLDPDLVVSLVLGQLLLELLAGILIHQVNLPSLVHQHLLVVLPVDVDQVLAHLA